MRDDFLIKLDGLTMSVISDGQFKYLIRESEIELPAKTSVGIVGESGSGKTLTVSSILGLIHFLPGITGGRLFLNYDGTKENVWDDAPWRTTETFDRRTYFSWQRKLSGRMKRYRGRKISIAFQRAKSSLNPFLKIKDQILESQDIPTEKRVFRPRRLGYQRIE